MKVMSDSAVTRDDLSTMESRLKNHVVQVAGTHLATAKSFASAQAAASTETSVQLVHNAATRLNSRITTYAWVSFGLWLFTIVVLIVGFLHK